MIHTLPQAAPMHIAIKLEPFDAIWPAIDVLAREHSHEVEPESPRRFVLDARRMSEANRLGFVRIHTARVNGVLFGYCTWNVMWDLESEGLPIATQGAWFVRRNAPFGLGRKLFIESLASLRSIGIQCAFPHHRLLGRGTRLDHFFRALGAIPIQQTYMLWIGEGCKCLA